MDALREMWDEWRFSWRFDPFAAAMNFLAGWGIGLFLGGSVMWWALA